MSRRKNPLPQYLKHSPSGQARVRVGGKDIYLGRYGSPESRAEYARIIGELSATPAAAPVLTSQAATLTIDQVVLAFWKHATQHYRRKDGTPTREIGEYKAAIRHLREPYGHTPAREFGPIALQAVRQRMIDAKWCRTRINKQVGRLKRVFKWAVSQELLPAAVSAALDSVGGLQKGRSAARETDPVEPVSQAVVDATLPHLWPTVRAMVELQLHSGMRPGEVREMTLGEIDRTGDVWVYRPGKHKMEYAGRPRVVFLGPRCQEIIRAYLDGRTVDPDAPLFSPAVAREERFAAQRQRRKSKVPPSQQNRRKHPERLLKKVPAMFRDCGYVSTIAKACARAGVEAWHPNQLRHTFATVIRSRYGLEAAQVLLGHARADVTQVYADRDYQRALSVVGELG